jgi:hypothetical protein
MVSYEDIIFALSSGRSRRGQLASDRMIINQKNAYFPIDFQRLRSPVRPTGAQSGLPSRLLRYLQDRKWLLRLSMKTTLLMAVFAFFSLFQIPSARKVAQLHNMYRNSVGGAIKTIMV